VTDEEYMARYGMRGRRKKAYCAKVEKKTGLPLAGIIESLERLGLKLTTLVDVPDSPSANNNISVIFSSPEGITGMLSFCPRRRDGLDEQRRGA
jgi:hypothetical protein